MIVTDDFINKLFEGTNFGTPTNESVDMKRALIKKTMNDEMAGYWSGSTAHSIVVNGGFLKDGKPSTIKEPTAFGLMFLNEQNKTNNQGK